MKDKIFHRQNLMHRIKMLDKFSQEVRIDCIVNLMKISVPEFKSRNSVFEKFDK